MQPTTKAIGILLITAAGLAVLTALANGSRGEDAEIIDQAIAWARDFAGVVTAIAGMFSMLRAFGQGHSVQAVRSAEMGVIGLLAGATLLGVGGWAAPIGLGGVVTGQATLRYFAWKHNLNSTDVPKQDATPDIA